MRVDTAEKDTRKRTLRQVKLMRKLNKHEIKAIRSQISTPCGECGRHDDNTLTETKLKMRVAFDSNLKEIGKMLKRVISDDELAKIRAKRGSVEVVLVRASEEDLQD